LSRRLFFAVPIELKEYALKHIPERAGLITVTEKGKTFISRQPKINKNAEKLHDRYWNMLLVLVATKYFFLKRGAK